MKFPDVKVQPHWLATLERAAEVLPNCHWVCRALDNGVEPRIEEEAREAIAKAIDPFGTVTCWLDCKLGIELAVGAEAQEYRKAWLNHMIEQCQALQEN